METGTEHKRSESGTVFIDSMSYIRRLEAKGYTQEQAEEQISVMLDIMNNNIASKADLLSVKNDLLRLETELKSEMKQLELRMVIKLGAIMLAGIGIMQYLNSIL